MFKSDDGVVVNVKFVDLYDKNSINTILNNVIGRNEKENYYD